MRILLHFVRLAALLLALSGIGAYVVWTVYPEIVARVERQFIGRYERAVDTRLAAARALVKVEPERAAKQLESLTMELSKHRKLDRLFRRWRRAAQLEATVLTSLSRFEAASSTLRRYAKHDDRDLPIAIRAAQILIQSDDDRLIAKGRQQLSELFATLPTVASIARDHIQQLAQMGDAAEIADALRSHLAMVDRPIQAMQNVNLPWATFWSTTKAFTRHEKRAARPVIRGDQLSINFSIPAGQTYLRFDPPPYSILELDNPRLIIQSEAGKSTIELKHAEATSGVDAHSSGFSVLGRPAPWFVVQIPDRLQGQAFEGDLIFDLVSLPSWMQTYLGGQAGRLLQADHSGPGQARRLAMIRAGWAQAHLSRRLKVQTDDQTSEFAPTLLADAVLFQCDHILDPPLGRVVISFPASIGDMITLRACDIVTHQGTIPWDASDPPEPFTWVHVDWSNGRGIVTGNNPRFRWLAGDATHHVQRVVIEGSIQ